MSERCASRAHAGLGNPSTRRKAHQQLPLRSEAVRRCEPRESDPQQHKQQKLARANKTHREDTWDAPLLPEIRCLEHRPEAKRRAPTAWPEPASQTSELDDLRWPQDHLPRRGRMSRLGAGRAEPGPVRSPRRGVVLCGTGLRPFVRPKLAGVAGASDFVALLQTPSLAYLEYRAGPQAHPRQSGSGPSETAPAPNFEAADMRS